MRFTFTLITFLFVTTLGWAQTILFQDTFEEDKNKWTFNGDGFDSKVDDKNSVDDFLSTPGEELEQRYKDFQKIYQEKIINLVYCIFYRFLLKNFPDKFI